MPSNYVEIEADNVRRRGTEFSDIGEFLAEKLYSERSHFVYELLQNAEDALKRRFTESPLSPVSRSVVFRLLPDRLEVRHFGAPFSEADVRGICDVLRGTKANDASQIGRFGIGFKSVYTMTAAPEIHSGDEHFRVEGYIRPKGIDPRPLAEDETLFVFPFNHESVSSQAAFELIRDRLLQLESRTLLFLRYVDEIRWSVEGHGDGIYYRSTSDLPVGRRVQVVGETGAREDDETWLVYDRPVPFAGGDIEVAFQLAVADKTGIEHISAVPRSDLVVYFPTAKETHLGFLIQGPFSPTPARNDIHSSPENQALMNEVGLLVADVLPLLRDSGLLTSQVQEVL